MSDDVKSERPAAGQAPHGGPTCVDPHDLPQLVSHIYETAPPPVRTKLLETLLRPVGPLALVAIAAGAFGHLLHRLTRDAMPISFEDTMRISSQHVLELARYVEQCSPELLQRFGALVSATPLNAATIGTSALLLALTAMDPRPRRSSTRS